MEWALYIVFDEDCAGSGSLEYATIGESTESEPPETYVAVPATARCCANTPGAMTKATRIIARSFFMAVVG